MLFFPHACKFVQIVYMCECWVNDWCISSRTHWLLRPACNWLCATGSYCLYSVSLHPSIDTCQSEILFTSLPSPVLFSSLGLIIFMPVSAAWGHKLSVCFRRLLLCKLSSVISALAQLMTWEREQYEDIEWVHTNKLMTLTLTTRCLESIIETETGPTTAADWIGFWVDSLQFWNQKDIFFYFSLWVLTDINIVSGKNVLEHEQLSRVKSKAILDMQGGRKYTKLLVVISTSQTTNCLIWAYQS